MDKVPRQERRCVPAGPLSSPVHAVNYNLQYVIYSLRCSTRGLSRRRADRINSAEVLARIGAAGGFEADSGRRPPPGDGGSADSHPTYNPSGSRVMPSRWPYGARIPSESARNHRSRAKPSYRQRPPGAWRRAPSLPPRRRARRARPPCAARPPGGGCGRRGRNSAAPPAAASPSASWAIVSYAAAAPVEGGSHASAASATAVVVRVLVIGLLSSLSSRRCRCGLREYGGPCPRSRYPETCAVVAVQVPRGGAPASVKGGRRPPPTATYTAGASRPRAPAAPRGRATAPRPSPRPARSCPRPARPPAPDSRASASTPHSPCR